MKPVFIKGISTMSPQQTFQQKKLPDEIITSENNLLRCIEPNYSAYLNPVMARRMGRVIKMGIASALACIEDAKIEIPGAIITGTALGCLGDTEKFLTDIIQDDEQFLTPTHFIQSIQNTVSAQIALQLKCTNHNFTFVHKGFSFESALIDAIMLLQDNDNDNILVGGLDEMTEKNFHIYNRLGIWKKENILSTELFQHKTPGTIGGEGASFFVLSNKQSENDYAILKSVKTIYNPSGVSGMESAIKSMLLENNLSMEDISLVLYGCNGDPGNDFLYDELRLGLLKNIAGGYFKHLCGEYQTSSAFALWIAAVLFHNPTNNRSISINSNVPDSLNSILIINNYENNFSISLLSR